MRINRRASGPNLAKGLDKYQSKKISPVFFLVSLIEARRSLWFGRVNAFGNRSESFEWIDSWMDGARKADELVLHYHVDDLMRKERSMCDSTVVFFF